MTENTVDPSAWTALVLAPGAEERIRSALDGFVQLRFDEPGDADHAVSIGIEPGDGSGLGALARLGGERIALVSGGNAAAAATHEDAPDTLLVEPVEPSVLRLAVRRAIERHVQRQRHLARVGALQAQTESLGRQVRDQTRSLAELTERQRRQSVTDGVTGLHNHRYFQEAWRGEVRRSKRYGQSVSLILLDLDDLDAFNQRQGHSNGDQLLKALALLLRSSVRDVDLVARYGGGSFVIVLPETSKDNAVMLAGRLREAVVDYPFEHRDDQPGGRVTVSVGVSCFPDDGDTSSAVLQGAIDAQAAAKAGGKDRVEVA